MNILILKNTLLGNHSVELLLKISILLYKVNIFTIVCSKAICAHPFIFQRA